MFRILLLVCAIVAVAQAGDIPPAMQTVVKPLHNTCVKQTGIDEDLIVRARKGDIVEDDKLKCYMKCLAETIGIINDDGTFDVEAGLAMLPPAMVKRFGPAARKCGTVVGSDLCDTAFKTSVCNYNESKDDYYLI